MIIKRLLSEIKSKLFSKSENIQNLIDNSIPVTAEIIKAIDFYGKDKGENLNHWIRVARGIIIDNITRDTTAEMSFVGALNRSDRYRLLGGDSNKISEEFGDSDKFLTLVKTWLLTSKGQKYNSWINSLNDFKVSNEDYQIYFKYITLCLCGVLEPEDWDTDWMWNKALDRIQIPNTINIKKTDSDKVMSILMQCVKMIIPYISY